jgi:tetratricopeptide (TPR) repeat protein
VTSTPSAASPSTATPPPTRAANDRPTRVRRAPPPVEGAMGIPQWTALIQEFPDYVQAFVERGILLYKTKRYENALYDFNKALQLDAGATKALYFRGCTYLACKRPKEALADLKLCLQGNVEAVYYCAVALTDLKDFNGALQYLDKAITKKPDHAKSLALRGDIRAKRKDLDGALADLTAALEAEPEDAEALSVRARVHLGKGNFGKALEDLARSLAIDPEQAAPYHDRGTIALRKQDYDAALKDLEAALARDPAYGVDPRYAEAFLSRARKSVNGGVLDSALQDYATAQKLRAGAVPPAEYADCYRRRAKARQEKGLINEAVADFEAADQISRAPEADAERVEALYRRAIARANEGAHDDALADLAQVTAARPNLTIDPTFAVSYGYRGRGKYFLNFCKKINRFAEVKNAVSG